MKHVKATILTLARYIPILTLMVCFALPGISNAQIVDPLREYTNPDEIVAFDKSTTYGEAIQINLS